MKLLRNLRAGDVVAILSNGGFDGIYEKLPARLNARNQSQSASMIASLTLLATMVVLGAPAALIFIPWALLTGNAMPLYNARRRLCARLTAWPAFAWRWRA